MGQQAQRSKKAGSAPRQGRAKAGPPAAGAEKPINLALQGGGAHGAFTWGVLDRLLEDERVGFEGITGTSAGAMNGAVAICGLVQGGRQGARDKLATFWRKVSDLGKSSPLRPSPVDLATGNWNMDNSPAYLAMDVMSRLLSPYQLNPWGYNPLREILEAMVDIDCLRGCETYRLFVSATNVRSSKIRVFDNQDLSIEALLASACLPTLYPAVEIDGEAYWDGGFMGNPALFPLFYNCRTTDVAIVQINPIRRPHLPKTAREILDRVNEISFNSSLMREMRAVAFVTDLIAEGRLDDKRYRPVRVHLIEAEDAMNKLGFSSKLMTDWGFLTHLRDLGRATAEEWLHRNFTRIGIESTIDIQAKFL